MVKCFDAFAKCRFGSFVLGFTGFTCLEISLIAFVYFGRCLAEMSPNLLAQLLGYGTNLAPFVMKLLKATVSGNYVLIGGKGAGFFKKLLFFA